MPLSEQQIRQSLSQFADTDADMAHHHKVKSVRIADDRVDIAIELGYPAKSQWARLEQAIAQHLRGAFPDQQFSVSVTSQIIAHAVQRGVKLLPGVRNIIAVASGKGGVGKSTTTVNLALALSAEGARVGVMDADIYGPSIPHMLGLKGAPHSEDGKRMEPMQAYGLQVISMGMLVDVETPMVWRGPMVVQALDQLLNQTHWSDLDYLMVDMPPGTGDIQLSLSQRVPLTGVIIVTTPQDIALLDARKGLKMFEKVGVPILGLIENMSLHICSQCGHQEAIFGEGGAARMAQDYGVEILGQMPLDIHLRMDTDNGRPTVAQDPQGPLAAAYMAAARRIGIKVAEKTRDISARFPTIVVQNT